MVTSFVNGQRGAFPILMPGTLLVDVNLAETETSHFFKACFHCYREQSPALLEYHTKNSYYQDMYSQPLTAWKALPNELILRVIGHLAFDRKTYAALCLVDRRLQQLIVRYKKSLLRDIAQRQYSGALAMYNPSSIPGIQQLDFPYLVEVDHRLESAQAIVCHLANASLSVVVPRAQTPWMRLLNCGVHLLYRLHDCPTKAAKIAHLLQLPLQSLALIYLHLLFSSRAAQIGPSTGIMQSGPKDDYQRMDLCLCFEECCLHYGPRFLLDIFSCENPNCPDSRTSWANAALTEEWRCMDDKQLGSADGELPPERTLTSWVREAIMRRSGCTLRDVYNTVWDVVQTKEVIGSSTSIAELVNCKSKAHEMDA
ncbi:hypothetical protein MMC24_000335 [Lignoscripta atroalba]|nr:hypothetical protein [Lignoscripta atroalba]